MQNANVRITTRSTITQVRRAITDLPGQLAGDIPSRSNIRDIFLSHFTNIFLTRIHSAFIKKSYGEADDLGNQWKPLAPSTIARKEKKRTSRSPERKDALTKSQKGNWTRFYNQAFGTFKSQGIRGDNLIAAARRSAWQRLQTSVTGSPNVLINRDTERLQKSIAPGRVSGTNYLPPPDQNVEFNSRGVSITFEVPYAKYVHKARPVYPPMKQMRPWAKEAVNGAMIETLDQLKRDLG